MKTVAARRRRGASRAVGFAFVAFALVAGLNAAKAPLPKVATLPPHEGEKLTLTDVDFTRPVYETSFDHAVALKDGRLEDGKRMSIVNGSLVLESDAAAELRDLGVPYAWISHTLHMSKPRIVGSLVFRLRERRMA